MSEARTIKPQIERVSLAFRGEGWQDCHVDFRELTWSDVKTLRSPKGADADQMEEVLAFLGDMFLSGQILDQDGATRDMVKEDLPQLGLKSIKYILDELTGTLDPKG